MRSERNGNDQRRTRRTRRDQLFCACSAASALIVVAVTALSAQQQALGPPTDPAAVERGQRLLVQECGFCHGANARGGSGGPDLTRKIYPVVMTATADSTHRLSEAEITAVAEQVVAARMENPGG